MKIRKDCRLSRISIQSGGNFQAQHSTALNALGSISPCTEWEKEASNSHSLTLRQNPTMHVTSFHSPVHTLATCPFNNNAFKLIFLEMILCTSLPTERVKLYVPIKWSGQSSSKEDLFEFDLAVLGYSATDAYERHAGSIAKHLHQWAILMSSTHMSVASSHYQHLQYKISRFYIWAASKCSDSLYKWVAYNCILGFSGTWKRLWSVKTRFCLDSGKTCQSPHTSLGPQKLICVHPPGKTFPDPKISSYTFPWAWQPFPIIQYIALFRIWHWNSAANSLT